ncbi:unnamed protein product, partial [Phaeothamnion confervicola]
MKTILIFVLPITLLTSCQATHEDQVKMIDDAIRKEVDDNSFRGHYDYEILELKTTNFKIVGANSSDSIDLRDAIFRDSTFRFLSDIKKQEIGNNETLIDLSGDNNKKNKAELLEYQDSLDFYKDKIHRLKTQMETRSPNSAKFYLTKTVLKGKFAGYKKMDTIYVLLSDDYKVL